MDNALIFIVLIIALIVLAVVLPRWIRRSTRTAGERTGRRDAESRIVEILDGLGATVVLHAPEPTAREIVDEIVRQQPRKFTALPDGGYGIRFIQPDDAVARLVEDPDGTRLQIEGFREYLGRPNTAEFWADLRSRVIASADARSIRGHPGPPLRHRREDSTGSWVLE